MCYEKWGKRILDVGLALIALVAFSPVLMLIALVVRTRMGSPALFKQQRPGLNAKPFVMLKFRSMTNSRDRDGRLLPDGQRLTPLGSFLRRSSLDELPELWNVLKGDMSLVGPRPLLMRYLPYFTAEERNRFRVKPGLTGLAQISGRNDLPWKLRLAKDVEYVQNCCLLTDIRILLATVGRVIGRSGVQSNPQSVMRDLDEERKGLGFKVLQ